MALAPHPGPQKILAAEHQGRRQKVLLQQHSVAVEVGENGLQQACPLDQPGRQMAPVGRRHDQGQRVELAGLGRIVGIGVDVEGDAAVAQQARGRLLALAPLLGPERRERADQPLPVIAQAAILRHHLVMDARQRAIARQQRLGRIDP